MKLTSIIGTAIAAVGLAACGSSPVTPTARPTLAPAATPVPTRSPTPVPTPPLVVTALSTGSGVQLTLVGEDGSIAATVDDPGGVDGASYYVGSDDVYFIDGTTVNEVLMPFAWSNTGISVSEMPKGLGGMGRFLSYVGVNAATFDPTSHTLMPLVACSPSTAPCAVCVIQRDSSTLKVERSSGTKT